MSTRRYLTFSDEAVAIMDQCAPGNGVGEWLSRLVVDYYMLTNGVMPVTGCGDFADIVPAMRMVLQQNAIIYAKLQQISES